MSYLTIFPNIVICPHQSPEFVSEVTKALNLINSKPVGKRLLEKIQRASHTVWITESDTSETKFYTVGVVIKGRGSDANMLLSRKITTSITHIRGETVNPFFIVFAHELIHVYHGFYGKHRTLTNVVNKRLWHDDEEYQARVGFPSKKNKIRTQPKITENAIRDEHALPQVYTHLSASELDKPELAQQIKLHSVAHQTQTAFFQLLETPEFLANPARLFFIGSHEDTPMAIEHFKEKVVVVTPNVYLTPPAPPQNLIAAQGHGNKILN